MKKTPKKILDTAHQLFNEKGVASVSLRQIAAAMGISHGNLIYHFSSKQEIIAKLHDRILAAAIEENQKLKDKEMNIWALLEMAESGFKILYEYRFFMINLNLIMREDPALRQVFLEVEKFRAKIYREAIQDAIKSDIMREAEYPEEYEQFITRIRIFSDYWIASSEIYDSGESSTIVLRYVTLFMSMFFPYLTQEAKEEYLRNR